MVSKVAFLDYQVIDHLQRIEAGTYKGKFAASLAQFESQAVRGSYQLWMSEISPVEMLLGRENPALDSLKVASIEAKDREKLAIASKLGVKWLGYPASKLSDTYSRLGMSFRLAGPTSAQANALELLLSPIKGVSTGDVRQIAAAVYGFDVGDITYRPPIEYFVTEDEPLVATIRSKVAAGRLPDLRSFQICSVAEFVAA